MSNFRGHTCRECVWRKNFKRGSGTVIRYCRRVAWGGGDSDLVGDISLGDPACPAFVPIEPGPGATTEDSSDVDEEPVPCPVCKKPPTVLEDSTTARVNCVRYGCYFAGPSPYGPLDRLGATRIWNAAVREYERCREEGA